MIPNPLSADRRAFLKAGTIAAAASSLPSVLYAQAAPNAEIKIALVGCGGRGSGAAAQSLNVPGTKLVAVADAFPDNAENAANALKQQFGPDYGYMGHFKSKFRIALRQVQARYQAARIELDGSGMRLYNSPPPVTKRLVALPRS